ncbi:hypothetical protein ACFP1I_06360 [Dyadobacter subterraneus]|uniref:Uncharacterized protein n=1 Tax=Dyadobacter subterraneus TaxID=2773304 RepID=A0ABR9WFH2_9BACT|nr:hypothetical protein [Dyadobacter subterraneus]MBE9464248.1 hypothetical protein [Dyadobacter subterraneus]
MTNSGISYNLPGTVSGVFFTKKDADMAYHALLKLGHTHDDISVLMSDETLNKYERPHPEDAEEFVTSEEEIEKEASIEKPKGTIINAIISITSMISIPGLGIAISNTLLKKIYNLTAEDSSEKTIGGILSSSVPEEHTDSYGDSMKEGGIIISVDPRNSQEKKAIVKNFRENNGQDILGDDGYTEF